MNVQRVRMDTKHQRTTKMTSNLGPILTIKGEFTNVGSFVSSLKGSLDSHSVVICFWGNFPTSNSCRVLRSILWWSSCHPMCIWTGISEPNTKSINVSVLLSIWQQEIFLPCHRTQQLRHIAETVLWCMYPYLPSLRVGRILRKKLTVMMGRLS